MTLTEPMNDPIYSALKKHRANLVVELEFATVGRDRAASLRDSAVAALAAADDMLVAYQIAWRDVKEAAEAAEAAGGPHPPAAWVDRLEDYDRKDRGAARLDNIPLGHAAWVERVEDYGRQDRVIRARRAFDAATAVRKAAADELCAATDANEAAVDELDAPLDA